MAKSDKRSQEYKWAINSFYPKGTFNGDSPIEVDAAMMAFPSSVSHLLPVIESIPEEFFASRSENKWKELASNLFYLGTKGLSFVPVEGIVAEKAWNHISCILRSFEPKHEYKETAVAFLLSKWFSTVLRDLDIDTRTAVDYFTKEKVTIE